MVRQLTSRHFAVNHIPQTLDAEAIRDTLAARPAVISFALGDPGDLVRQAHDVGSLVMVQVTTVAQAIQAAEQSAGVIIAQGGEAGGYCGEVSTMALVPQVVDAVSPIPVVAAGGIFDGRGIPAAVMLGAVGVNLGTRVIASPGAPVGDEWKQAIARAQSGGAGKRWGFAGTSGARGTGGLRGGPSLAAHAIFGRVEFQARGGASRSSTGMPTCVASGVLCSGVSNPRTYVAQRALSGGRTRRVTI